MASISQERSLVEAAQVRQMQASLTKAALVGNAD